MVPIERDDMIVLMEAGYVYLGMQKYKEAKTVFEGAVLLAPASEVPLVALGSVYFAQRKFDQAIRHYKKALKINSESPFAHSYHGEALFFKGKEKEALESLKEAVRLDPEGKSGEFAIALLAAIKNGFAPPDGPPTPQAEASR